ncbi:MAG: type II secretion system protein GspD, partial [Planctomycetota bacterium]
TGGAQGTLVPEPSVLNVGILLVVKPIVSYDKKYITLEIIPQIVRLQGAPREVDTAPPDVKLTEKPRAPVQLPWLTTQSAFTTVRVPDKGSIIIAGLRNILKSKITERVPVLGRIPILGTLFKRKQKVDEKRNTVIILTAEILDIQEEEKKNF